MTDIAVRPRITFRAGTLPHVPAHSDYFLDSRTGVFDLLKILLQIFPKDDNPYHQDHSSMLPASQWLPERHLCELFQLLNEHTCKVLKEL